LCHKIGTIYNLVDRAILLLYPNFQQKNLEFCIKLLANNGYSLDLIFREINKRLKKKNFNQKTTTDTNKKIDSQNINKLVDSKKYFVIPYIRDISEIASQICNSGVTVGFRCLNKKLLISLEFIKTKRNIHLKKT